MKTDVGFCSEVKKCIVFVREIVKLFYSTMQDNNVNCTSGGSYVKKKRHEMEVIDSNIEVEFASTVVNFVPNIKLSGSKR